MALRSLVLSALAARAGAVWLAGVNIAGCEFGMNTNVREHVLDGLFGNLQLTDWVLG